jgi:signal transduction histidine kinase
MDFRSGYSLHQSLTSFSLHPPYKDNDKLQELGFAWDQVQESKLRLIRSLLPPRHDLFGLALSAVPDPGTDVLEIQRHYHSVLTQFTGLQLERILDRVQIQRLDQLKTELISTVSHELRTPLTSIQGFSDYLLRSTDLPETLTRNLQIIKNESMRLNRLINNFLDLARLESGQLTLTKEPFDPMVVVENAVKLLKPQAERNRAMVRLHCDRNLPHLIADQDRIEQAMVNLIGNAIKYGGTGVHIDIHLHASSGHTIYEVSDSGPGISSEELPLVFNRFYRGVLDEGDGNDVDVKGTGLGLSLTREIVEQHGGTITAESIPHEKTSFRFSLPSQGLISPQRGITAWHPGDEEFTHELANRIAEGKTVGVLTIHVNPGPTRRPAEEIYSVEALNEIEEIMMQTSGSGGMEDTLIQSRPQGEFIILTYASVVDECADRLIEVFEQRFGDDYALSIGAAVSSQGEKVEPERIMALSLQACQYIERTQKRGYLKNRRMAR